jgi:hypothetical protein
MFGVVGVATYLKVNRATVYRLNLAPWTAGLPHRRPLVFDIETVERWRLWHDALSAAGSCR